MSEKFSFDYTRYTKGGLSVKQIDALISDITKFKTPDVSIPTIGPFVELAILGTKIASLAKLLSMRKKRVDLELLVSKQIYFQNTHKSHNSDVLG